MPDKNTFPTKNLDEVLSFMNRVDAALIRRPSHAPLILSVVTCLMLIVFILWASVVRIDEVTHGQGQVVPSQRTQIIENLEGGIVRDVLVSEGQIVKKDQVLMRLDNEMAESVFRDAANKILENKIAILRLEAELRGQEPIFPDDLQHKVPQIVADQRTLFDKRDSQRAAEKSMLRLQFEQREHEVDDLLAKQHELASSLAIVQQQVNIVKPLFDQKNYSHMDYLELQQKLVNLQGSLESIATAIPKARAAAREAEQKLTMRRSEMDSAISEELNKKRSELASFEQTLAAGSDRVVRKEIRSPVRGTVKQVMVNTIGGVAKPGETLMEIVPLDDTLIIEARIRPADIAFIRPQQKATVKITAYDSAIYGTLSGEVETISADTIEDKKGDHFYNVRLRTSTNAIHYKGKELPIIPGMVATVDILTGEKTIMNYLLKPILKASQNALHER